MTYDKLLFANNESKRIYENYNQICKNFFKSTEQTVFYKLESWKKFEIHYNIGQKYSFQDKIKCRNFILKHPEVYKNIYNFSEYIVDNFDIMESLSGYISWYILKIGLCNEFYIQWKNEFTDSIQDVNLSLESIITKYCKNGFVSPFNERRRISFTCYLMGLTKTQDDFFDAYSEIYSLVSNENKKIYKTEITRSCHKYTIDDVDMMTGSEFELFINEIIQKMGYETSMTKKTGDQGIDIVADKNSLRIGIQCKRYSGTVGNHAVQEAVAGKKFYKCDKVIVVTNNYFTSSASSLAEINDVILWDRNILKDKL